MASFVTSTTPDITEGLVAPLSARTLSVIQATQEHRWDVTVGGIGFCVDPDGPRDGANGPYLRQTVPVRKQQTDVSDNPGEQSLDGYWIRSQNSWHRGAGINFYEPGAEENTAFRFAESSGLDVWTQGQVTALKKMSLAQAAAGDCYVMNAGVSAGTQYVVYLSPTAVLGWDGPSYSLNPPAAGHNGRYYFFGYKNYYKVGWTSPADPTIGVWNGGANTVIAKNATVEPRLWYVKDRIIAAHGPNLFEIAPLTTTPVDLADTMGASCIHKPNDTETVWLDVVDGPAAIYAAHSGGVMRFALQDASSGSTPKLSQAYRVLELPAGETIKSMFGYLGRFLILSTSAGIRVCAIDGNGNLTMGQVIVTPSGTVGPMSAFGDVVYLAGANVPAHGTTGGTNLMGWGERTGMLALNLGQIIDGEALRFAYANDQRSDVSGTATGTLVIGQTRYLAVSGSGVWKSHATDYVPGGYLAMGRVRYNTLIKKVFRSLDLFGSVGTGTLRIDMLNEADSSMFSVNMDSSTGIFESVLLPLDELHAYLRPVGTFTWTSGTPVVLTLLQLRAMPAPARVRQLRFPLKCFDREQDRNGQTFIGKAADRVFALEELEDLAVPVTITDHRTGEQFAATIDEIQFSNTESPDRANDNYGGVIQLTVTKLT